MNELKIIELKMKKWEKIEIYQDIKAFFSMDISTFERKANPSLSSSIHDFWPLTKVVLLFLWFSSFSPAFLQESIVEYKPNFLIFYAAHVCLNVEVVGIFRFDDDSIMEKHIFTLWLVSKLANIVILMWILSFGPKFESA